MPRFFLGGRRENRMRKPFTHPKARRQPDAADGLRFLIFLPSRAGEVPARDAFDWRHARLFHQHRATLKLIYEGPQLSWIFRHLAGDQMILKLPGELLEPEQAQRREDVTLVGNAVGHD